MTIKEMLFAIPLAVVLALVYLLFKCENLVGKNRFKEMQYEDKDECD